MFRSRRPVPSEAALRVLRQLAYISSGTACGAAAIIAEERRRQISVASKIADNSRRLKQHPRYQHSQASSRHKSHDHSQGIGVDLPDGDAFRSNVLPSEVEKGYEKFSHRRGRHDQDIVTDKSSVSTSAEQSRSKALPSWIIPRQAPTDNFPDAQMLDSTVRLFSDPNNFVSPSTKRQLARVGQNLHSVQLNVICRHMPALWGKIDSRHVEACYMALFSNVDHRDMTASKCRTDAFLQLAGHGCLSGAGTLFSSMVKKQGQDEALIQLDRYIRHCPSTALDLFFVCTASLDLSSISATALVLFGICLQNQMFADYQTLLEWMYRRGLSISDSLHGLLYHCVAHRQHDLLLELYRTFSPRNAFPQDVYRTLCAVASKESPSVTALIFMKHIPMSARESVLPSCELAWPAILQRMWSTTKSISLVDKSFLTMCRLTTTGKPSIDLYNAMIRLFVEAGEADRARECLREIQESNHTDPDVNTFGHFVLAAAKSSDWPTLDRMMQMLNDAGKAAASPEERTRLFVPVLLQYVKQHTPEEVWSFASEAIDIYDVLPTQSIYETVAEVFVRAHRLDLLVAWTKYTEVRPSAKAACGLIRRFYIDTRPSHEVLMWLCRRLVRHVPEYQSQNLTVLLREAIAFDLRNLRTGSGMRQLQATSRLEMLRNLDEDLPSPRYWHNFAHSKPPERLSIGQEMDGSERLWGSSNVRTADNEESHSSIVETNSRERFRKDSDMLVAMSLDQESDTVRWYKESLAQSGLPPSSYSLEMAVQAHMKMKQTGEEAEPNYIQSAHDAGMDVTAALVPSFIERIRLSKVNSPSHIDNLYRTIFGFYERMVHNNVNIRHHLATAAASVLIEHNKADDAIHLLARIHHSSWADKVPLDMPAMTVFLQAYIKAQHREGIVWIMELVLGKEYRIDRAFIRVILRGLKWYRRTAEESDSSSSKGGKLTGLVATLSHWLEIFQKRQTEQKAQTARFGQKLVDMLIDMAKAPVRSIAGEGMEGTRERTRSIRISLSSPNPRERGKLVRMSQHLRKHRKRPSKRVSFDEGSDKIMGISSARLHATW